VVSGGTFADCTSEATEIATGSGVYYLDLTATEMNADTVAVITKTTTSGAKTTVMVFYPLEDADLRVNVAQWAGSATATTNVALKNTLAKTTDVTGFNDIAAGTAMTLTSVYDPSKTASQAGDAMALTTSERTTLSGVIWNVLTSTLTTANTIGKLLVDNINATISSRSTYAGGDTPGTTTLLSPHCLCVDDYERQSRRE
jgi:hypothetical protein